MSTALGQRAMGQRALRQARAQERLRDLLEQWLLRRSAALGPGWRDVVVTLEREVDGPEVVVRVRIPGLDGPGRAGAAMRADVVYLVAHRRPDSERGLGFSLRDLATGAQFVEFPMPARVAARQIAAVQRGEVLEIRMPARRSSARH